MQGRSYKTAAERNMRFERWRAADNAIILANSDKSNTFVLGHNNLSDWTEAEYHAILLPFDYVDATPRDSPGTPKDSPPFGSAPGGGNGGGGGDPCDPSGKACGICETNHYAPVYNA